MLRVRPVSTDVSVSSRDQHAFPMKGPMFYRCVGHLVSVTVTQPQTTQKRMTRCDALYRVSMQGWGRGTGDRLVLLTPTPCRTWLKGSSPRFTPSQTLWAGSRELPRAGFCRAAFPRSPVNRRRPRPPWAPVKSRRQGSRFTAFGKVLLTARR